MIAIGPYEQRDVGGGLMAWCPPPSARGAVDLRSLAMQGDPGACVVDIPEAVDGFEPVGESWDEVVSGRTLASWRAKTRARDVAAGTVADLLWQTLTVASDPTGQSRQRCIMPTRRRQMELHCGGLVRRKPWRLDAPEAAPAIEVMREDYREARKLARDGKVSDPDHHRRVLDYLAEKLNISDADVLIPRDLPRETRLPHATVLNESFDKSDSSGWDADLTWATIQGTVETVSNRARGVSAAGLFALYADSALSGPDMYAEHEIEIASSSSADYMGPLCRHPGSTTLTHYWIRHFNTTNGQSYKYVAGNLTPVGVSTTTASMADGLVSRLECDGSNIIRIYDGTTENTASDFSITGNNYAGIRGRRFSASLFYEADNWEGGDLGAAPVVSPAVYLHRTVVVPTFGG